MEAWLLLELDKSCCISEALRPRPYLGRKRLTLQSREWCADIAPDAVPFEQWVPRKALLDQNPQNLKQKSNESWIQRSSCLCYAVHLTAVQGIERKTSFRLTLRLLSLLWKGHQHTYLCTIGQEFTSSKGCLTGLTKMWDQLITAAKGNATTNAKEAGHCKQIFEGKSEVWVEGTKCTCTSKTCKCKSVSTKIKLESRSSRTMAPCFILQWE